MTKRHLRKSDYHPPGHPLRGHSSRVYPMIPGEMNATYAMVLWERHEDLKPEVRAAERKRWRETQGPDGPYGLFAYWRALGLIGPDWHRESPEE